MAHESTPARLCDGCRSSTLMLPQQAGYRAPSLVISAHHILATGCAIFLPLGTLRTTGLPVGFWLVDIDAGIDAAGR